MIREFKLTNSSGVEYNLTEAKSFLFNLSGLGYSEATEYRFVNNHYKPLQKRFSQWAPSGVILFANRDTCYEEYHNFILFCQDSPLVLSYFQHQKYYHMQVAVSSVEKSEIGEREALECAVKFIGLSPWYEVVQADQRPFISEEEKQYNYQFSPRDGYPEGGYVYGGESSISVSLRSESRLKSPMKIRIFGPVVNPSWSLTCGGKIIGTGRMIITVDEDHALVVDNTTPDFMIQQQSLDGSIATDVYQLSDFNTDRFVYLEYGLNTLTVVHEGSNQVEVEVIAHVEYESV